MSKQYLKSNTGFFYIGDIFSVIPNEKLFDCFNAIKTQNKNKIIDINDISFYFHEVVNENKLYNSKSGLYYYSEIGLGIISTEFCDETKLLHDQEHILKANKLRLEYIDDVFYIYDENEKIVEKIFFENED